MPRQLEKTTPSSRTAKARPPAKKPVKKRAVATKTKRAARATTKTSARASGAPSATPTLLSGGNPQIAKADGDAPVQAYIAAAPGWKQAVARRLDALVTRTVPKVRKAVKWNSPFYGMDGRGWFLSFHCFNKYVKVSFFNGASLKPLPPVASKHKDVRYLDVREDDQLDEQQFASWVTQAAKLPGWST